MTSKRPDLLTPEERELAERLGRIAPRVTPSAELDARILGAAHAAAGRKVGPAHSRSRWPALVGIAATVALAVGVVWQLRPVHEVPTVRDETPSSAVIRSQGTVAVLEEVAPAPESDPVRPAEPRSADGIAALAQPSEPRLRMLSPPAPKPSPPVVFDDPSPVHAPKAVALPAPPAPPPPPAPPAPAMDASATVAAARTRLYQSSTAKAARMQSRAAPAQAARTESAVQDASVEPDTSASSRTVTIADVPVDSDRLLDPVDWIERIRQRRDSGDLDSARASLDALRDTHPTLALPEDVLAIATAPATPPER